MGRILVTGATGFIGQYVVNELLKNGHHVIASSLSEEKAARQSWYTQVQYIPFDLSLVDAAVNYYDFFGKPDAMIHLSWEGLPYYTEAFHYEVNLPRHFSFLQNLVQNGLPDLTVTGTCFEYGMHDGMLSEERQSDPANPYAQAKDALRKALQQLQQARHFEFKWLRLFYMYGKGQNAKSLFSQLQAAMDAKANVFNMSGGEQLRDFLPVERVAEYIVKIAGQHHITGIINCCSGQPVAVKQLVQQFVREQQSAIRLNFGYYPYPKYEPMAFWGDNKRLNLIIQ